mgnify:CR=1 FL=1
MFNIKDKVKLLDFFKTLNQDELDVLFGISNINSYPKGYTLYYEEELKDKIYFLVEGVAKTYKVDRQDNEIFLNYIYNDTLISEISSLDNNQIICLANTEFIQDSVVLEIDYTAFKEYFIKTNILTAQFLDEVLRKNKQLYCIIDREVVFDATAKVAYSLYDDLEMFNKLKRQDIANMLHIQPATLSRVLKKLLRQNIIEVEATTVSVLKKDELKKIFSGVSS